MKALTVSSSWEPLLFSLPVSPGSDACFQDFIPVNTPFNRQFLDLLRQIFVYDPKQRITAKEALKHPWFKESIIDDGTEAYRIGMGLHRQPR